MITILRTNLLLSQPAERPKPGVYETAPYSGIVVVPGAHADDRTIISQEKDVLPSMPMREPALRFIPRERPKK